VNERLCASRPLFVPPNCAAAAELTSQPGLDRLDCSLVNVHEESARDRNDFYAAANDDNDNDDCDDDDDDNNNNDNCNSDGDDNVARRPVCTLVAGAALLPAPFASR
jgi:hypothetical protein